MRIPDMAAMWLGWTEMPPTSILSFVINSSRFFTCFLSLARRFWNQIFTWEVVKYLIKRGDRVGKNHFFNTCIWISCPTSDSYLVLSTYVDMVLKEDKNASCISLPFWQAEGLCELGLPPDGDVAAVVELLLQLQSLVVAVHDPVLVFCSRPSWKLQKSLVWIRLEINHSFPSKISVAKHQDYISFVGAEGVNLKRHPYLYLLVRNIIGQLRQ